jgi:hypothetical protein
MAHDPTWARTPAPRTRTSGGSIACFLFVAAMGAAFWVGALWASQAWFDVKPF